ncbi:MAG: hypothetical protein J0H46_02410 [Bacteroidetes bacterium]|nr:hypothetical protein [Bacteroidota bacterium]
MNKQSNTGWYVIGGIALFIYLAARLSRPGKGNNVTVPIIDSTSAPDTAANTEIIITGK